MSVPSTGYRTSDQQQGDRDRLLAAVPTAIFQTDADGRVLFANERFADAAGATAARLAGRPWTQIVDLSERGAVLFAWNVARTGGREFSREFRLNDESRRWVALRIAPVTTVDHELDGWVGVIEDVTEIRQAEAELSRRATHDPLTDLPNRSYFEQRLSQASERARRARSDLALLFIDLDGFKQINDERGHAAGDDLLRQVGERLAASLRASDTVARYGGDEFTVLCEDIESQSEPVSAAERISEALEAPFTLQGEAVNVTCSVGIAVSQRGSGSGAELVAAADAAMYRAKAERRPYELAAPDADPGILAG